MTPRDLLLEKLEKGWDGQWVEGPPPRGPRMVWPQRLAPLRENPGMWARFGPYAVETTGHQVAAIKGGRYGPGFDAYRRAEDRQDWIYVSFNTETDSDA